MRFREDFADIATGTDDASAALRARYHLPLVADTAVVAVQDGHICAKALRALNKDQDASHAERRRLLLVVRVSDVFVVSDPTYKIGEWSATTVFDSSFKTVLARIAR